MQNRLVCFFLLVIPLNLTNCLNAMNILILNMPRDMNLKFSCFDLYVSDYAYRSGWRTVCLFPKFFLFSPIVSLSVVFLYMFFFMLFHLHVCKNVH